MKSSRVRPQSKYSNFTAQP